MAQHEGANGAPAHDRTGPADPRRGRSGIAGPVSGRVTPVDDAAQSPTPDLAELHWTRRPRLKQPVVLTAFRGWNDAGDAATEAAKHLARHWRTKPFAELDPENYFDFTVARPLVHFDDEGQRRLTWPTNRLSAGRVPGTSTDVVILEGVEPHFRWGSFCRHVLGMAQHLRARLVVTLGALLADVPHTRPVAIYGSTDDTQLAERLQLRRSSYEGPTGIVGVLGVACREAGVPTASLWASVPAYAAGNPSPKATLALTEQVAGLLGTDIETADLHHQTLVYEQEVDDLVNSDDDAQTYVAELEKAFDNAPDVGPEDPERLVQEVEKFLRDQS
ncbi:MAG: PAC2 family protein [Acidimicrobiia bacterium]|nr:PAC2 family protein [Acidimicrobiia bacterium]MYJ14165.1 PAC2 family protein [Acidimicrobiia bacterium]